MNNVGCPLRPSGNGAGCGEGCGWFNPWRNCCSILAISRDLEVLSDSVVALQEAMSERKEEV